jgi:hypothetical protein
MDDGGALKGNTGMAKQRWSGLAMMGLVGIPGVLFLTRRAVQATVVVVSLCFLSRSSFVPVNASLFRSSNNHQDTSGTSEEKVSFGEFVCIILPPFTLYE